MDLLIKNVELNERSTDVLIDEGRFCRIEPDLNAAGVDKVLDGRGKAILPTFVNAHTHASMTLLRSYADDLELHDWLQNYIWPVESQLTEEDIYHGARLACLEMIRSGTTCFNDMYWHYPGIVRAVEEMGLRAVISSVFIDFENAEKAAEQRQLTEELFTSSKTDCDRITFSLGPHAIYTVSKESLQWIRKFADKNGLLIHIHLSETEKEVQDCLQRRGVRPVEYLDQIGFLGPDVFAAHAIHLSDEEIGLLARNGVKVVHNPASNMKLSSGSFQYGRMKEHGVEVLLGTDGCSSNNNLCMLDEMRLAALHAKQVHSDPTILPAGEVFEMATRQGALALGVDAGLVEVGRLADCMLVDLSNHRLLPGYNLTDDMVYSADSSCIDTVMCNGRILMENGRVEAEEEIVKVSRRYKKRFGGAARNC